ncbi:MAG: hypothetical protein AAGA83_10860 [Cyanobacteria bacterium P01_F01_bin.116]
MSDLASAIDAIKHINPKLSKSNLHTPLRYSGVLLSIGKTTHICHQNIPLKKIHHNETITYGSAIPLKLNNIWPHPTGEIASRLVTVLQQQSAPSLWASIRQTENHWIEFVISEGGMAKWRQQLLQNLPLQSAHQPAPVITATQLWSLQAGYEQCCRWQRQHCETNQHEQLETIALRPFTITSLPLSLLIHGLLDICDRWDEAQPKQLLHQANQLVKAIEQCTSSTPPTAANAAIVFHWLKPTQHLLRQLLQERLRYQCPEEF